MKANKITNQELCIHGLIETILSAYINHAGIPLFIALEAPWPIVIVIATCMDSTICQLIW